MAKLKFKNGSSWTEIPLGIGGTLDQQYPVGSFYISPIAAVCPSLQGATPSATYNFESATSPATIYGGTWNVIKNFSSYTNTNYNIVGLVVSPSFAWVTYGDGGYDSSFSSYPCGINKYTTKQNLSYYDLYTNEIGIAPNMISKWTYGSTTDMSAYKSGSVIFVAKVWQRIA